MKLPQQSSTASLKVMADTQKRERAHSHRAAEQVHYVLLHILTQWVATVVVVIQVQVYYLWINYVAILTTISALLTFLL